MEEDLTFFQNGRRPQFFCKFFGNLNKINNPNMLAIERRFSFFENGMRTQTFNQGKMTYIFWQNERPKFQGK